MALVGEREEEPGLARVKRYSALLFSIAALGVTAWSALGMVTERGWGRLAFALITAASLPYLVVSFFIFRGHRWASAIGAAASVLALAISWYDLHTDGYTTTYKLVFAAPFVALLVVAALPGWCPPASSSEDIDCSTTRARNTSELISKNR